MSAGEKVMLGIAIDVDASGVIRGVNLAESAINRVETRSRYANSRLQNQFYGVDQGMRAMARGTAMVGGALVGIGEIARRGVLSPVIQEFGQYDESLQQMRIAVRGNEEEFERLRQAAVQIGMATQFTTAQSIDALTLLRTRGMDTEQAIESLKATLDFSAISAGMVDPTQAAIGLSSAFMKFRSSTGESVEEIGDSFAFMRGETGLAWENLNSFINSSGDLIQQSGMASNEVFALGGMLKNQGEMAAEAGHHLQILQSRLVQLATAERVYGDDPRQLRRMQKFRLQLAKELGVNLFDPVTEERRPFIQVMADIIENVDKISGAMERETDVNALFSTQSRKVIYALRDFQYEGLKGADALRRLVQKSEENAGSLRRASDIYHSGLLAQGRVMLGVWKTVAALLGEGLAPILAFVVIGLKKLGMAAYDLLQKFPKLKSIVSFLILSFVVLTITSGSLLLALSGVLFIVAGIVGTFAAATYAAGALSGALYVLGYAFVPLLVLGAMFAAAMLLGLLAVVLAIISYKKNFGGFKNFIDDWIHDLKLIWKGVTEFYDSNQISIGEDTYQELEESGLSRAFLNLVGFLRRLQEVWQGVKDVFGPVIEGLTWGLTKFMGGLVKSIDMVEKGLAFLGIRFDKNMTFWRALGWILGVVIVGSLFLVISLVVSLSLALGVLGVILGAVVLIGILPWLILGAIIVGLILAVARFVYWLDALWDASVAWAKQNQRMRDSLLMFKKDVDKAVDKIKEFWATAILGGLIAESVVKQVISKIRKWWDDLGEDLPTKFYNLLKNKARAVLAEFIGYKPTAELISSSINEYKAEVLKKFASMVVKAREFGQSFIQAIIDGISRGALSLVATVTGIMASVRDLLPGSDAKAGPLSTLTQSGTSFVETFRTGMMSAMPTLVSSLSEGLSGITAMLGLSSPAPAEGEGGGFGFGSLLPIPSLFPAATPTEGGGGKEKSSKSVIVNVGGITVQVQQASQEEAERLSNIIIERIKSEINLEMERSFA